MWSLTRNYLEVVMHLLSLCHVYITNPPPKFSILKQQACVTVPESVVQQMGTGFSHILGNHPAVSSSRMASGGTNQLSFHRCLFPQTSLGSFSCELCGCKRERGWMLGFLMLTLWTGSTFLCHISWQKQVTGLATLKSKDEKQTFSCWVELLSNI